MKKYLYLFLGILFVCGIYQACTPEDILGSIYGTVVDEATGEPIKSAGVELSPVGLKTVTGSEGQFEFRELDPGIYTLIITKTGYMDGVSHTIEVKPGQQAKGDVQIEKMPPALKVVDGNREEISTLNFGSSVDDVSRSFSLFNNGYEKIEWQITINAKWIKSVSRTEGTLSAGATQSLLITIDRALLNSGENKTTVHITSNSGNKQLIVIATNNFSPVTLNTFAVTNISNSSATFHGEIIEIGTPKYTERGFVYSKSSMPTLSTTIKKITSPVTDNNLYEETVTGLIEGNTYYVRAYAVNDGKTAYSTNEVSFVAEKNTINAPTVTTSSATNVTTSSATIGGNVTSDGETTVTERGVCYSTSNSTPTTSNSKKSSGSGLGNFTVNLTNLSAGTKYYVRAYAINEVGTSYGSTISFTTEEEPSYSKPTVTTSSATNVTTSSATIGGNVTSDGESTVTERGVCYSTSNSTPTTSNSKKSSGSGLGNFTVNLTNLSAGTKYYVRAYAINEVGTSYGSTVSFTTEEISSTNNTENGYQYVDLGLSVKWATCNVGASNPEEYGKYFAWGETTSKSYYNGSTYTYTDNPTTLPMSVDAARANWGGKWRMPTIDEFEELRNNCTWKWTTQNGVNGYKVTSNSNGNYIFLPAAGYRDLGSLYGAGDYGYYWSSSAYGPNYSTTALYLYFYSTWKDRKNDYKAAGRSVRPVCP